MKALVLSPARLREDSLVERFDYYARLLRNRVPIERRHVKGDRLVSQIPKGWYTVALDERGEQLNTREFATLLETRMREGRTGVAFLIGAADGLSSEQKSAADERIALSKLTLPHQLCFVLLAEQIYRATTVIRGEPYHRD
jgi:23S rRNA (pseudouridine1915-N3)-methyltransferase